VRQPEGLGQRRELVAGLREAAARQHERVERPRDRQLLPRPPELCLEERHVVLDPVPHQDDPVEQPEDLLRQRLERGRARQRLGRQPVDLAALPRRDARVDQGVELGLDRAPPAADDAGLAHPVGRRVEARHLEIDERERRLVYGQIPRAHVAARLALRASSGRRAGTT
jgi:hypothetical protein